MINIDETIVNNLIFHRLGMQGAVSYVNTQEYPIADEFEEEVIKSVFLKPFTNHSTTYEFVHDVQLKMNVLFRLAKDIYEEEVFSNSFTRNLPAPEIGF